LIRAARASDAEAVTGLVERAFAHYVPRIGRRPAPMNTDYAERIERGEVHVIGEPVTGAVVIGSRGDHAELDLVAVDPDHQGSGLGRELMSFAEQDAIRHGFSELRLHTNERMTENLAFYARFGYEEYERRSAQGYSRVYFRKRLRG
jgi:ribosomal protein S18 acetylase RimI-like enzyme